METKEKENKNNNKKKKKNNNSSSSSSSSTTSASTGNFKPCSEVKGIRFGGQQFIVKSFTVRRCSPFELLRLLSLPPSPSSTSNSSSSTPLPSSTAYIPTNFTILAHKAWHTLTLGLGTNKSKAMVFVFESESMKSAVDRLWPNTIPLGDVNKKVIRSLTGCEMARFKFRKGCLTFYVYAVRRLGAAGFFKADDLRQVLEAVVDLKDFLDHTAMLAMPNQRSITFQQQQQRQTSSVPAMAH